MRRTFLGALALLLCWSTVAGVLGEGRAAASPRPVPASRYRGQLAGTTVVSGSRAAMQVVSLARDVVVEDSVFGNPLIDIDTTGRLGGLVLKEITKKDGFELLALELAHCDSARCHRRAATYAGIFPFQKGKKVTIPAGDYFLYLLSDGAPVEATLRLPGVPGSTRLRPIFRGNVAAGDLDTVVEESNSRMIYSGTSHHPMEHAGISIVGARMTAQKQEITEIDSCMRDRKGADVPVVHHTLCLDGAGGLLTYEDNANRHSVLLIDYALVNAGDYQHTLSYRAVAEIEDVETFHAYVDYPTGTRTYSVFGLIFGWSD